MKRILTLLILCSMNICTAGSSVTVKHMLAAFVTDFRSDPAAAERAFIFGINIEEHGWWHVQLDGKGGAELNQGMPSEPTIYYQTDYSTLKKIYDGTMSALTAMGRARMSDRALMNFGFMEGFTPDPGIMGWGAEFTFHFWCRGMPEIVNFSDSALSRTVHGAQAKILYYEKGFRSSWYGIMKGQHINRDQEDQVNPFPSLVIMINGMAEAKIGGKPVLLKKGMCVHIPAGVSHEFWNTSDETAEFIIVMFGEGA